MGIDSCLFSNTHNPHYLNVDFNIHNLWIYVYKNIKLLKKKIKKNVSRRRR